MKSFKNHLECFDYKVACNINDCASERTTSTRQFPLDNSINQTSLKYIKNHEMKIKNFSFTYQHEQIVVMNCIAFISRWKQAKLYSFKCLRYSNYLTVEVHIIHYFYFLGQWLCCSCLIFSCNWDSLQSHHKVVILWHKRSPNQKQEIAQLHRSPSPMKAVQNHLRVQSL